MDTQAKPAEAVKPRAPSARPKPHLSRTVRRWVNSGHTAAATGLVGVEWAMIALGLTARESGDPALRHACYRLMLVLVFSTGLPLAALALISGVVLCLRTPWGLFKHAWTWLKLILLLVVIVLGVAVLRPWIHDLVGATAGPRPAPDLPTLQLGQLLAASGQLLALLAATALSIFKPSSLRRRRRLDRPPAPAAPTS